MFDRLEEVESRHRELEQLLGQPEIASNPNRLRDISRELAELRDTVGAYREWKVLGASLAENQELLGDADVELVELAQAEIDELKPRLAEVEERLKQLLLPRDPNDTKNVVLEIRAGTGGDEASLFAAELLRMYSRYAETVGWRVELLSLSETAAGGIKEVIATIIGKGVYGRLKHESGVHRVQRVPETESQGRIHTSTVTVAVLPEAEEVDVAIDEKELRIDVYRSSGPGGQSVNTTDSAVRITHLPTNLVVTCQDEKSQHTNKGKALKVLRARLLDRARQEQQSARAADRRAMIGTGDRSEKVRTYNFPQNRVTDHRVNLTLHQLERVLDGDLDAIVDALASKEQAEALEAAS